MASSNLALIKLGRRIKEERLNARMSQTFLSFKAGFNFNYIGILEKGTKNVSFLALLNICKALDIAVEDLLEGIEVEKIVSIRQKREI